MFLAFSLVSLLGVDESNLVQIGVGCGLLRDVDRGCSMWDVGCRM